MGDSKRCQTIVRHRVRDEHNQCLKSLSESFNKLLRKFGSPLSPKSLNCWRKKYQNQCGQSDGREKDDASLDEYAELHVIDECDGKEYARRIIDEPGYPAASKHGCQKIVFSQSVNRIKHHCKH